jgi:dsDNA-specific endonuclease/ATPase MutS2
LAPSDDEEEADDQPDQEIVEVEITDELDLHTFAPRDVADLTANYIELAHAKGFAEVRVVHGKGEGVLRRIVHGVLGKHPLVASWRLADEARGGWGATIVTLRRA